MACFVIGGFGQLWRALGQVEDVLRLLLRTFRDEGYSVDDVAAMVRVVLWRIENTMGKRCSLHGAVARKA